MVLERQLDYVCVIVPHPTNPELFLGVSRKDDHDDFGLPGGKLESEMRSYYRRPDDKYFWKEDPRTGAVRELKEETGLVARSTEENLYNLYTRTDEDGKHCRCYFVRKYSGEPAQPEGEGVVKWCTWDELESGSFGDYNKQAHKKLNAYFEKLGGHPTAKLIGLEITRMNNADWKISYQTDKHSAWESETVKPFVFTAKMKIEKIYTSDRSSAIYATLTDQKTLHQYTMTKQFLDELLSSTDIKKGFVEGVWSFEKTRHNTSLKYFMEAEKDEF